MNEFRVYLGGAPTKTVFDLLTELLVDAHEGRIEDAVIAYKLGDVWKIRSAQEAWGAGCPHCIARLALRRSAGSTPPPPGRALKRYL